MLDKSERMDNFVNDLIRMLGLEQDEAIFARRAVHLAKADLATQMVMEMTSLQGIIGREYALRSGEQKDVGEAIGQQYQPVPQSRIGVAVALTDRIDSLVGLFAAGLAPTGAKDPFGLRRAAIGIVQPLIEHRIWFDLRQAVSKAAKLQSIEVSQEVQSQVLEFITGRLSVVLKDMGYKYDVVEAVLAEQRNAANPAAAAEAVKQLQAWVEREDWSTVLPAFARCVRITRNQEEQFKVSEEVFTEPEEKNLFAALEKAEALTGEALSKGGSAIRREGNVDDFLKAFLPMIPAVNAFFDKVLVMAEDKKLQENRLALLQRIAALSEGVADLGKLEGF
jgi:glycyl-tRNA synthetase